MRGLLDSVLVRWLGKLQRVYIKWRMGLSIQSWSGVHGCGESQRGEFDSSYHRSTVGVLNVLKASNSLFALKIP